VNDWVAQFHEFWSKKLDALGDLLDEGEKLRMKNKK